MLVVDNLKKEIELVNALLKVLESVPNKERFSICDIPEEYVKNPYRQVENGYGYNYEYTFSGASLKALERRGFIEAIDSEDFIFWNPCFKKKCVGTRKIYRVVENITIEDYKTILAELIYKRIMQM